MGFGLGSCRLWTIVFPIAWVFFSPVKVPTQNYQGIKEKLPAKVNPQPVSFSHKQHSLIGLPCNDCHNGANKRERAGLPKAEQCMLCHQTVKTESPEIIKLAGLYSVNAKLDWIRIYKVPDFVFFSHGNHARVGIGCTECHGPVEKRDRLQKEISTSMEMCMDCHRRTKASLSCNLCHELGQ